TGVTSWVIERRDPGNADFLVVGRVGAGARRFTDSLGLADGKYFYRIKAVGDKADSPYRGTSVLIVSAADRTAAVYLPWTSPGLHR
ncbi:MAG: hypothetical protein ACE5EL_03780, partial [Anaerolineae bacterium]